MHAWVLSLASGRTGLARASVNTNEVVIEVRIRCSRNAFGTTVALKAGRALLGPHGQLTGRRAARSCHPAEATRAARSCHPAEATRAARSCHPAEATRAARSCHPAEATRATSAPSHAAETTRPTSACNAGRPAVVRPRATVCTCDFPSPPCSPCSRPETPPTDKNRQLSRARQAQGTQDARSSSGFSLFSKSISLGAAQQASTIRFRSRKT